MSSRHGQGAVQRAMVDLDNSLDALVGAWLDRITEEGVDPVLEARAVVDQAPHAMRPMLQAELGSLMQMAQATVQGARLRAGGRVGGFSLVRLLGAGSTGSVWEVQDASGERFALKVLHPLFRATDEGLQALHNELEQRRGLAVPHLVPAHGSVEADGILAVVFSLIGQGQTLAHHITAARDGDAVHEPRKVLLAILPALRALARLHAQDIAHGDLKPGNLVLDDEGLCHLSDLGLARPFQGVSLRLHGHALGTPAYLAPEHLKGMLHGGGEGLIPLGPAGDIWSAGVLLQEALTLHRPFVGSSIEALSAAIEARPASAARLERASVSRAFERSLQSILTRCLELRPEDRYANAGELVEDLERLLADEPVVGSPRARLLRQSLARHSRAVLAVCGAVVLGLLGTAIAQHYRGLNQRLLIEEQGTERANALLDHALSSLRRDALDRESQVQSLLTEMATLVGEDAPGDPTVRASILSQFAFLVSETPLPNREALPAIERLSQGALALLPQEHSCARAEVWIQQATLATRSWRFDLAEDSWGAACQELERGIPHETDPERRQFETLRLAWCRGMWGVSRLEQAALYSADTDLDKEPILEDLRTAAADARALGDEPWALRCELAANQLEWRAGGLSPLIAVRAADLVEALAASLGTLHPWTLDAQYNAAFVSHRVPEQIEATEIESLTADRDYPAGAPRTREEFAQSSLEQFEALERAATLAYGSRHLLTALATLGRGQQIMLIGDPPAAVPLYEEALETLDRVMQPSSEKLRRVWTGYGLCLWYAGRAEEAREVLETQVRLCDEHLPDGSATWTAIIARRGLSAVLIQLGLLEEHWELLRAQWEGAEPRLEELRSTLLVDLRWSAWSERLVGPSQEHYETLRARLAAIEASVEAGELEDDPNLFYARWAMDELNAVLTADAAELDRLQARGVEFFGGEDKVTMGWLERYLICRGSIAAARGEVATVGQLLEEARAKGFDTDHLMTDLECSRALAAVTAGDPGPARALLTELRSRQDEAEVQRWIQPQILRLVRALEP